MLSAKELAERAGCSTATVYNYCATGKIAYQKAGATKIFGPSAVGQLKKAIVDTYQESMKKLAKGKEEYAKAKAQVETAPKQEKIDFTPVKPPEETQKLGDPEVLAVGNLIKKVLEDLDERLTRIERQQQLLSAHAVEAQKYNRDQWATVSAHLAANNKVAMSSKDAIAELKQIWT